MAGADLSSPSPEMFTMQARTLAALLLLGAALPAQSIVVPNANANLRGTGQLNSIIRNAASEGPGSGDHRNAGA